MSPQGARPGWAYLVGAGPGDPELITLRGAELLRSADLVLHDELVDLAVLRHASGEVRSVGKRGSSPDSKQAKQAAINEALVAAAQAGKSVVRLKGGDPFLFGRGAEEVLALRAASIPFEVVPGIPSPVGATAYAGIPLTHRRHASSVTFVTAVQRDGGLFDWRELASLRGTVCVFMGVRRLAEIAAALVDQAGRAESTPAAVVSWISYPRQRTVSGTLADIASLAADLESPALLVVGEVVTLRDELAWFDRQPLAGKRVLVTRPAHQADPTARLLRRRGAEPVLFPTIAIEPVADREPLRAMARDLARYDLVVFTSDNGVRSFFATLDEVGLDARALGHAKVAVIGPATAAGLRRRGIAADIVAETFVAEHLAAAILTAMGPRRGRVLLPRARLAREALPQILRAEGFEVEVVPVYDTVAASSERAVELQEIVADVDVVMLTSSSTVDELCALLDDAPKRLAHCKLASIGPVTTATAIARGLDVAITAEISTVPGLVDAIELSYSAIAAAQ